MDNQQLYIVSLKGLPLGSHVFEWVIDGSFFAPYEMSEISGAGIDVQLTLVKHARFLELRFALDGWAEVSCDRCLDTLKLDVETEARMFVKFGDHAGEEDSDDDVIILQHGEDQLSVAQYLYEYAHLSLPVRRVHPEGACNADMIGRLEQYLVDGSGHRGRSVNQVNINIQDS